MMKSPIWFFVLLAACSVKRPESMSADTVAMNRGADNVSAVVVAIDQIDDDSLIQLIYQEDDPGMIGSLKRHPGEYVNTEGKCTKGTLLAIEWRTENGEERFDLVWIQEEHGGTVFSPFITFDNSDYQGASSVLLSDEHALSDACRSIAVVQEYEGGDIDLTRTATTSFYAV
ncbi:MAG TPA: hypothetical protein VEB86_06735, partial [Chryseosolibacter sp.]|nr:hypothetical protein [Chryseosolibacter sp.]